MYIAGYLIVFISLFSAIALIILALEIFERYFDDVGSVISLI